MRAPTASLATRAQRGCRPLLVAVSALTIVACGVPVPVMPAATVQAVLIELTPTPKPPSPAPTSARSPTAAAPLQTATLPLAGPSPGITVPVRPTATAVASPTSGRREVSFNGWYTGENPGYYRATLDTSTGAYHLIVLKSDYNVSVYAVDGVAYSDVTVEVDAWRVSGPDGGGYGLVFQRQPKRTNDATSRRYIFEVTPQGTYRLYMIAGDGAETDLVPPTPSSAIKVGDAVNRLSVTYARGAITLAINGAIVGTASSAIPNPGEVGVYASSAAEARAFEAGFQNFVITVP